MLTGLYGGTFPSRTTLQVGDQSSADMYAFAQTLSALNDTGTPQPGGRLTLNSQAVGAFDYHVITGNQTVSAFTSTDWFTNNTDIASAWVVVKGNLTINAGQTFQPATRKLFTVVYVTGNLQVDGALSMSARGANHSTSGSNITATNLLIITGTFSTVVNPQIPSAGGGGGAGKTSSAAGNLNGNTGTSGSAGGTGGGGGGGASASNTGSTAISGSGAAGTCFSGGGGGGGTRQFNSGSSGGSASNAGTNGGSGGRGDGNYTGGSGGSGNPGGISVNGLACVGQDGTGGVLVFIVEGTFSGAGTVSADGLQGGNCGGAGGGGSGGGSVTGLIRGADTGPTPTANGGAAATTPAADGGAGGNGTARKLVLV